MKFEIKKELRTVLMAELKNELRKEITKMDGGHAHVHSGYQKSDKVSSSPLKKPKPTKSKTHKKAKTNKKPKTHKTPKKPKKSKKDMLPALMQNKIDGNAASSSIMSPKTMQQLNFRREGQYNLPSTFSPRSPPMSHS